ncbi:MAG: hydroxymethylglutaryl-CoA reductase, degradative [Bacteroidetes bacterium]|nr:hydroxymethylglutaryl-CoA reductase, degradative [Bacteroidota bacterium]
MKGFIYKGFSKLTEAEKRKLVSSLCDEPKVSELEMDALIVKDPRNRELFMDLSENTVSAYHLPFGISPNFVVNGNIYHVPMVTEESSVVAASASAARFWSERGGFVVKDLKTTKLGHVYFQWFADDKILKEAWPSLKLKLLSRLKYVTANMVQRGGGITRLDLSDDRHKTDKLFRLIVEFDTVNSMGANFINTCLEELAQGLDEGLNTDKNSEEKDCRVVMSILSNYVEECTVTVEVCCPIRNLQGITSGMTPLQFAQKVELAYQIAWNDVYRAATHNKGIMNGVDAVIIATGNDWRAVEAGAHAFASRSGQYRALSQCELVDDQLRIWLTIPLALGTVGGITNLHPLAKKSLEILGNPNAPELMCIVASAGLASNFAAVQSLVTTGIQKGHMRLHLMNIFNALGATPKQITQATEYFQGQKVSFAIIKQFIDEH